MSTMIISFAPQNVFAWLTESNLMRLPSKDPHDDKDEDENEQTKRPTTKTTSQRSSRNRTNKKGR